jgi:hypothetical protein
MYWNATAHHPTSSYPSSRLDDDPPADGTAASEQRLSFFPFPIELFQSLGAKMGSTRGDNQEG